MRVFGNARHGRRTLPGWGIFASACLLAASAIARAQSPASKIADGLAAARAGDCIHALSLLTPAASGGASSPETLNAIAVCESRLGHPREATGYFEQITELEPGAWQVWNNLGGNYLALGRTAEALVDFRKAIGLDPSIPSVWFNQASALLKLGRKADAWESLDHARRMAPNDPQIGAAWIKVAGLVAAEAAEKINRRKYAEAQNLLLRTERPLARSAYWNNLLGYADFKLNQPKPALAHLQTALQLAPNNVDFLMDLGEFLAYYRAYHQAVAIFQIASKRLPDSPEVKFGLAVSYILENRRQEATPILQALIAAKPDFQPAYRALGECYEDAGDGKAMVGVGKQLEAINRSNPMGWYLVGAGFLQESARDGSLLKDALPSLERAATLDPGSARDHFMLGKAYAQAHDYTKAVTQLQQTLRLDPAHDRAHYVLARVYQQLGDTKLAQTQFAAHNKIIKHQRNADYRVLFTLAKSR